MPIDEIWLPGAAVVAQERGDDWFEPVDDIAWSVHDGFHRGFRSSFRIRGGRAVWFHFPFATPAGACLESMSLLWEAEDDAAVTGLIVQHGGMERHALTPPDQPVVGEPVSFAPPEQWRAHYPPSARRLATVPVEPPITTRFGIQLSVRVASGDTAGTVRFYGAGTRFSRA